MDGPRFASKIRSAECPQFKQQQISALICFFLQRFFVNKTEMIEHIANQADISKAAAGRALEALIGGVRTTLKKGGTVRSESVV